MKKLAPFFSFLMLLVTSCTVESVDQTSERNQSQNLSQNLSQNSNEPTFMSGDVNNVSYSNLKPLTYYNVDCLQTNVESIRSTPSITYNYLHLQGSDITLTDTPQASSVVINIRIPESQWAVGTYELKDDKMSNLLNGVDSCAGFIEIGSGKKAKSISGTLVVTEFDLVNKVIKGTFSFSYFSQNGEVLEGPFQVNNGAFKYKLDAPYFAE